MKFVHNATINVNLALQILLIVERVLTLQEIKLIHAIAKLDYLTQVQIFSVIVKIIYF